jgi:protease I
MFPAMTRKRLAGVRVAVLAADGFEQVEVTSPNRALRKEGADVRIISLRPGRIRGINFLWPGRKIPVDDTVFTAAPSEYTALLLPGGFINPDLLRQSERAREFVRAFDRLRKPIALICHGAETLISAELIKGRRLTSWPGIADDVRNAGGIWENRDVVRDANWVSSRGPHDLPAFNEAMVSLFDELAERELVPPPRRVRWVASLARLAGLALLGAIGWNVRRRLVAARA